MKVEDYRHQKPKLDLFAYLSGKTYAWGQFQNRSGKVLRRFTVEMTGTVEKERMRLDEHFFYHDGEREQRVWTLIKVAEERFVGRADDVIGEARGRSCGNAFHWRYTLALPYKSRTVQVQFDDWMFLHNPSLMMNRAQVTKWGFKVGEVTLCFSKQPIRLMEGHVPDVQRSPS